MASLHINPNWTSLWQRRTILNDRVRADVNGTKKWLRYEAFWTVAAGEPDTFGTALKIFQEMSAEPWDSSDPSGLSLFDVAYPIAVDVLASFPGPDPNVPPGQVGPLPH